MILIGEPLAGLRRNHRRNVVKEIIKYIADGRMSAHLNRIILAKAGLVLALAALMVPQAWAQPANDLFANALALSGNVGSVTGSNIDATLENCEPTYVNADDFADDKGSHAALSQRPA